MKGKGQRNKVFLYSDPHFGHVGVTKFLREDGTKLRPWDNTEQMDEDMVRMFNETVGPQDKVYFLGDCVINRKHLHTLGRLNGDKILIKGNHDIFDIQEYLKYFRDIRSYHVMNGMILSHIPVHESQLYRFGSNIHGHLHSNEVKTADGKIDPRYICVCVEQTEFKPILLEDVQKRIVERGGVVGFKNGNY